MRPKANQLAMRDRAMAALMGAIGSDEDDFGGEYDDLGWEFGVDIDPAMALQTPAQGQMMRPPPQAVQALWNKHVRESSRTEARTRLLEPNKGSSVKVERYAFACSVSLVLGTASAIDINNNPDTNIRPQRVTANAPAPGFVSFTEIKVANVSVLVGGTHDAFDYSSQAVGSHLDLPLLTPSNRARVTGNYSGFTPPGYVGGSAYLFTVSFKGPASIVA